MEPTPPPPATARPDSRAPAAHDADAPAGATASSGAASSAAASPGATAATLAPAAPSTTRAPAPPFERRRHAATWGSKDVLRAAALVFGMYVLARLLWYTNELVLTAFLGVLFGLAVSAGVDRLQRRRVPRGLGAALIVVSFYALLIGFGAAMAPTLREQSRELRAKLPEAVDKIDGWINSKRGGLLGLFLGDTVTPGPSATASAPPPAPAPATPASPGGATVRAPSAAAGGAQAPTLGGGGSGTPQSAPQSAPEAAAAGEAPSTTSTLRARLGGQMGGVTRYLFPFLSSTFAAVGGLLLITFLAIYIGADPDLYHRGLMHLFPHRARSRAGEVLSAMATVLRKWLVTQLIAMAVIGAVSTLLLLALRVKAAFALGILAGLFEFIPTIGPILSAIPAIAMGFLDSPEKALYVALGYWGIQFLENHILIPLLMKGGIDLPPALTILSQALMAIVFGFIGLMVAVPMLAAALVPVKMLYVEGVVGDPVDGLLEEGEDAG